MVPIVETAPRSADPPGAREGSHTVQPTTTPRRLTRPRDDRWIAGVCSGLARRFGLSPGLVRVLFVLSCLLPGPQFLLYIVLWAFIPSE